MNVEINYFILAIFDLKKLPINQRTKKQFHCLQKMLKKIIN